MREKVINHQIVYKLVSNDNQTATNLWTRLQNILLIMQKLHIAGIMEQEYLFTNFLNMCIENNKKLKLVSCFWNSYEQRGDGRESMYIKYLLSKFIQIKSMNQIQSISQSNLICIVQFHNS